MLLRALLLAGLLMAGITDDGVTISVEDNAHGDAGGDGSYAFTDISTKFPALFVDKLTNPRSYECLRNLRNGDGVGTAVTTIKDANAVVHFAANKTFTTSAVGGANRTLELGTKVVGANGKPTGYAGCDLYFNTASQVFSRHMKLYGLKIQNIGGALLFQPSASGMTAEIVNGILLPSSTMALGNIAGAMSLLYNVDIVGTGVGSLGRILNFNCTNAERLTIAFPFGTYKINITSGQLRIRDAVFIGPSSVADVGFTGTVVEIQLVEPTWSREAIQQSGIQRYEEWWRWEPVVINTRTRLPEQGATVNAYNLLGTLVATAVSDADGRLSYGSGLTANCLQVRHQDAVTTLMVEDGPFTVTITPPDGTLLPSSKIAVWPYRSYSGEKQFEPFQDQLELVSRGGEREEWRPDLA